MWYAFKEDNPGYVGFDVFMVGRCECLKGL